MANKKDKDMYTLLIGVGMIAAAAYFFKKKRTGNVVVDNPTGGEFNPPDAPGYDPTNPNPTYSVSWGVAGVKRGLPNHC